MTAVTYFSGLEELFVEQRDLLIKKLNADFEVVLKMVEKRRAELTYDIKQNYNSLLEQAVNLKEGLQALYGTIDKIKAAEIRVDIDQINLNRAIEFRVREIENDINFKVEGNRLDLINSRLLGTPFKKIEKALSNF